jgi:hypothetical protein
VKIECNMSLVETNLLLQLAQLRLKLRLEVTLHMKRTLRVSMVTCCGADQDNYTCSVFSLNKNLVPCWNLYKYHL